MDDMWERSIPLYCIENWELKNIFHHFNKSEILDFKPIDSGCRNSNYVVKTNKGRYLLRICPPNDRGYKNEIAAFKSLHTIVNIPELLCVDKLNDRTYLIYQYIEATSLQAWLVNHQPVGSDIIAEVAKSAAMIHNLTRDEVSDLEELELPPFTTWYDLFLDNEATIKRLGVETVKRVRELIANHNPSLQQIDSYHSFIHCDFRPANMLINKEGNIFFVDWEYACFGHTLADIGQFFRYRQLFNEEHLSVFQEVYNNYAKEKLPDNWYSLSKLRELINPLQMIGSKQELPHKFEDLKPLVHDTLNYFKY